jgi:uridine kinase
MEFKTGFTCGGIVPSNAITLSINDNAVYEIVNMIRQRLHKLDGPMVVAIAGGSASGKSTFAEKIFRAVFPGEAVLISGDDYYKGRAYVEESAINFDHPDALDLALLAENLRGLKQGKAIQKPIHSFLEDGGKRIGYEQIESAKIIIVDSLFALNPLLLEYSDLKIFVKTDSHGRFVRRAIRDIPRTNWEPSKICGYFHTIVDPMHRRFIDPQERVADVVIINPYNPITEPENADCIKEEQCKVALSGPLSVKKIYFAGANYIAHTDQEDSYFIIPGKQEDELLRIRKEGTSILFTYKAPAVEGVKNKVEFPLCSADEVAISNSCQQVMKIFKSRSLFSLRGMIFSQDCVIVPGKPNQYFLEIREGDLSRIQRLLKELGLEGSEILKSSYYELLK